MLILLANIHHAKEQDWGPEFCAAMAALWKKYSYNHVHDATSMTDILKELAGADELQAMKLAPAHPTPAKQTRWANTALSFKTQMTAGTKSQATQTSQAMMGWTAHRRKV